MTLTRMLRYRQEIGLPIDIYRDAIPEGMMEYPAPLPYRWLEKMFGWAVSGVSNGATHGIRRKITLNFAEALLAIFERPELQLIVEDPPATLEFTININRRNGTAQLDPPEIGRVKAVVGSLKANYLASAIFQYLEERIVYYDAIQGTFELEDGEDARRAWTWVAVRCLSETVGHDALKGAVEHLLTAEYPLEKVSVRERAEKIRSKLAANATVYRWFLQDQEVNRAQTAATLRGEIAAAAILDPEEALIEGEGKS